MANVVIGEVGTDNLIVITVSYLKYLSFARGEFMCRNRNRLESNSSLLLVVAGCPALLLLNPITDAHGPASQG